ncbi:GNAT family N-acetyltransferase [Elizabethkingia meningoseptica]|uniref:GNAT family N-acetyltransferase n=1 Tax=Elizabethkingia meningoseptica TaxID=238 RepID=UPI0023B018CD|nr:GNAT family N-acetyltransferase [Elizabethkingia meningoseptica]MDE5491148.1 GNAT family N-acetyltransferase [Elizabethkingia meningoseptica]
MKVRKSEPKHHLILTEIAKKSKKYWGYPEEWMKQWDEDLTLTEAYIAAHDVWHIEDGNGNLIGFYSFYQEDEAIRLDFLFINPDYIGNGYGKILLNHFFDQAKELAERVILDADPYAEKFYQKFGFETVALKPTTIKGRFLPLMSKII